ncbi:hypothetical protein K461DRAFT_265248 [Myriangium duriaei CBS 260.36]|uniref:CAP-Gly domain-containing protein n=1 Tax=Myriangium duriaei CBS 260.36 TaxID=1168546 RepID=A0A9P4J6G0_9PEZI|nr:hypothetical protein K461DRAFT_265248 [Myriangium duriaei CBS 260.36]
MSTYTPRPRGSARPSTGASNSSSSPSLLDRASTNMHRKASLNALIGQAPTTPASKMYSDDFAIGEIVNVPGDMFGTVRFLGSVRGKPGRFLGVELDGDFAARGKNSGDVDGVNYFRTSIPGSGIFLPVHRAQRRFSPSADMQDDGESPGTPTISTFRNKRLSPGTPSVPKFAQTVGPGARPPSPQFKPKPRQSLPRPESPLRRQPNLQPTPGRQFSQSLRPASKTPTTPSAARSATPKLSASVRGGAPPTRPYSRTGSRLGNRPESAADNINRSPSRLTRPNEEIAELQATIANKDKQLSDQTAQLLEMEAALKELQTLLPTHSPVSSHNASRRASRNDDSDLADIPSLRRALKERNDKISTLVSEFDGHRADFRSTIEALELASDETVRMYETRLEELISEIGELREQNSAQEDVEAIAGQLKMLEELVAELEDGLEDARRGEAEARGEVEFLRGEVERGRSELRREREKASAPEAKTNGADEEHERELEMRDDEIRGLKAILHSLQSSHDGETNGDDRGRKASESVYSENAEAEVRRLQASLQQLEMHSADLEAQLREQQAHDEERRREEEQGPPARRHGRMSDAGREHVATHDDRPAMSPEKEVRCEGCDKAGHELLHCPMFGRAGANGTKEGGKKEEKVEEEKWCALCEQDGHLAFDCPNEQY